MNNTDKTLQANGSQYLIIGLSGRIYGRRATSAIANQDIRNYYLSLNFIIKHKNLVTKKLKSINSKNIHDLKLDVDELSRGQVNDLEFNTELTLKASEETFSLFDDKWAQEFPVEPLGVFLVGANDAKRLQKKIVLEEDDSNNIHRIEKLFQF